jgi:hypothetical protein
METSQDIMERMIVLILSLITKAFKAKNKDAQNAIDFLGLWILQKCAKNAGIQFLGRKTNGLVQPLSSFSCVALSL